MKTYLCLLATLMVASSGWGFTYIKNDNTGLPLKWPAGKIPITIMLGDTKLSPDQDGNTYNSSAKAAADTWNAVMGDAQFSSTLLAAGTPADHNGTNDLAFAAKVYGQDYGTNVLAVTTAWYAGNQRTEADTLFNTTYTWGSYRGFTQPGLIDIQRVAIHELGHNLGLDHPDVAGQSVSAIMNSHVGALDTLADDDVTGVQNLYGPPGVPANDNFANAITITLGSGNTATVNGFNTNATKETKEPNHAGNIGGHSVWWKWTAPSAGSVTIDTRGSYSDTTLGIYTGSSVDALTSVASDDDIQDGVIQASTVTFTVTAGTTYYIAVDGFKSTLNTDTADSSGLTLNLNLTSSGAAIPVITTQPASQTVAVGGTVTFSVVATTASGTLSYQWYQDNSIIPSGTTSTFGIANVQVANAGNYSVTVTNSAGSVTSANATLTVTTPPAKPPVTSGGGGGGGGAPSLWFCAALSLLGLARRRFGRHR